MTGLVNAYRELSQSRAIVELQSLRGKRPFSFDREIVNEPGFTTRPNTNPITFERYREIRAKLIEIFPHGLSRGKIAPHDFDRAIIEHWDHLFDDLTPFDASLSGVWSFLTLRVLFDIALLRFPDHADERYLGKSRNVFWRLYQRRDLLGPELAVGLLEDEAVQIMERTMLLGSSPNLARAIAFSIVFNRSRVKSKVNLSLAVRETIKDLRRDLTVVAHQAIPEEELKEVVNGRLLETIDLLSSKRS